MKFFWQTFLIGMSLTASCSAIPTLEPTQTRRTTITEFSGKPTLQLRGGSERGAGIDLGIRSDESVTSANLQLTYTTSPSMLPNVSHIKVTLNDEVIAVLPVKKNNITNSSDTLSPHQFSSQISIDPRLFVRFNRLNFQLVGHYTMDCEYPTHSSLWAEVSGSSILEYSVRQLPILSNLTMLPEPFFDKHDFRKLILPFIFPDRPRQNILRPAAVVASWFGQLAGWRNARFPASFNTLPKGHAIVFATNEEYPSFLQNMLPVKTPSITVMTNPADGISKLLVILGRNAHDLDVATNALVLGHAALSGTTANIENEITPALREAYDAPNWVRTDRPMKFGELVTSKNQLQVLGRSPDLVRIDLRIPPDLFTWRSQGVPMNLKYRYTPPIKHNESRLTMSINDEMVKSIILSPSGQGGESDRVRLPLLNEDFFNTKEEVFIPAFKLGGRNQLQFAFNFVTQEEGAKCASFDLGGSSKANIDADSRIDFSGFPHYAVMPNLSFFSSSGFPFTKYADLSQTVVVIPDEITPEEVTTLLSLMGRMGESTGTATTKVTLANSSEEKKFKDADLLIIGTLPQQSLLSKWSNSLPAYISASNRQISQPIHKTNFLYSWFGFGIKPNSEPANLSRITSNGALSMIMGFESPITAERSVVAITANNPANLISVLDALDNPIYINEFQGSVAFIHPNKIESRLVGNTYTSGSLPWWSAIWFPLSERPMLLAMLAVFSILLFAFGFWRTLKSVAKRRLTQTHERH